MRMVRQENDSVPFAVTGALLRPPAAMEDQAAHWFHDLLPNGGVSVWWEDWSAVAGFAARLRASQEDVISYCAKHPNEYQALHAQVMVTDVNEVAVRMMRAAGKSQLIGPLSAILPYSVFTFPQWLAAITAGVPAHRGQTAVRRLDGELCECLITAALPADLDDLSRIAVLVIDITEYRGRTGASVLSAIQHASRLSAMCALTASIAHEIKNPLAAVVTNAGAARRWLRQPEANLQEAEEAIAGVVQDANRAREIVDRTLSFLRPVTGGKEALDIVSLVNDVIVMVMTDLRRSGVEIDFRPEAALPRVIADPVQVQQILINLILNAAQALTGGQCSRLITLRATEENGMILVEVTDRGPGITPEQFGRLFEPFYSTKSGGIGMGLAVCRACVEANGGRIWASSALNAGSSFFFTLPARRRS
jgi:signal transduction histidine kinase